MINAAWTWLDGGQRALLHRRYWRGQSVDQVAATTKQPASAVRRAELAALQLCRRVIAGLYDPQTGDALPTTAAPT